MTNQYTHVSYTTIKSNWTHAIQYKSLNPTLPQRNSIFCKFLLTTWPRPAFGSNTVTHVSRLWRLVELVKLCKISNVLTFQPFLEVMSSLSFTWVLFIKVEKIKCFELLSKLENYAAILVRNCQMSCLWRCDLSRRRSGRGKIYENGVKMRMKVNSQNEIGALCHFGGTRNSTLISESKLQEQTSSRNRPKDTSGTWIGPQKVIFGHFAF